MEIKFAVPKEERKALVKAIGEIIGCAPVYKRTPSLAYTIGDYIIDKNGTLVYDEDTDTDDIIHLLAQLNAQGFVYEASTDLVAQTDSSTSPALKETGVNEPFLLEDTHDVEVNTERNIGSSADTPVMLSIEVPLEGFTSTALCNLNRLVSGKSLLIMKALGADALPIERTETSLCFPWFSVTATGGELDAYARFVHALCDMAKKQTRVTLKEKTLDGDTSDKFAFRCFLLRLGFIGKEFSSARNVLLSRLSGNGSFKNRQSLKHLRGGITVNEQNFVSKMTDLLSITDTEGVQNLIIHAKEMEKDETVTTNEFFENTFSEFYLVVQGYGVEIARKLLDVCKTFVLNPFEIRGAAYHLFNGIEPPAIGELSADGKCDPPDNEPLPTDEAMKAFEAGTLYKRT